MARWIREPDRIELADEREKARPIEQRCVDERRMPGAARKVQRRIKRLEGLTCPPLSERESRA